MKRRDVIKGLTILGGTLPVASVLSAAPANDGLNASAEGTGAGRPPVVGGQIFQSLGVEPLINCMGTFTIIGGSLERASVRTAMEAASKDFVQYDELATGIGKRFAELTGAEWGMVSAGCAAGLKHVTAACVTGGNPSKLIRIPDLTGFEKNEVVIPTRSRNVYDHAIRNIGVKVINVDTPEELENALSSRTAMIYMTSGLSGPLNLEVIVKAASPKNIPVLVDAAAEDLTVPCIHLQKGATIVAYSGGKALCGPQCSGILLGKKDILQSAWQASSPHHGPGRDNKVGREEMIGALAAVEAWIKMDHDAQWKTWLSYLETVSKKVSKIDGVKTIVPEPTGLSNRSPSLFISWDPLKLNMTGEELAEEVGRNKPRIALAPGMRRGNEDPNMTGIRITAGQMQPGNDKIVAERLHEVLSRKRAPKPTGMTAPSTDLQGRWDVAVEFYSSKSTYTWVIEQNGNWIQGKQSGDFSNGEVTGTIEGDKVKLRSREILSPGDHISFTYTGAVSNGTITGSIYLVEYGTAQFTATRHRYPSEHAPINVPGGPPLAT